MGVEVCVILLSLAPWSLLRPERSSVCGPCTQQAAVRTLAPLPTDRPCPWPWTAPAPDLGEGRPHVYVSLGAPAPLSGWSSSEFGCSVTSALYPSAPVSSPM